MTQTILIGLFLQFELEKLLMVKVFAALYQKLSSFMVHTQDRDIQMASYNKEPVLGKAVGALCKHIAVLATFHSVLMFVLPTQKDLVLKYIMKTANAEVLRAC
jgi:hypothetical protein